MNLFAFRKAKLTALLAIISIVTIPFKVQSQTCGIWQVSNTAELTTALTSACGTAGGGIIRMAAGTYTLNSELSLCNNVVLEGGYNSTFTTKSSLSGLTVINRTQLSPGSHPDGTPFIRGLVAVGASNWRLQDLQIEVANAAAGSRVTNYAVYVNNCSNYNIVRCRILSGNAGSGTSGIPGASGGNGGNGQNGQTGHPNDASFNTNASTALGGTSPCGCNGGNGGQGSWVSFFSGSGGAGGCGGPSGGAGGGDNCNLFGCSNPGNGVNGTNGFNGGPGSNGALGAAPSITTDWGLPGGAGATGANGGNGTGGSGGGGGGAESGGLCDDGSGGDGGGGGGGGCGGAGGTGGTGGGNTFCIFIANNGGGGNVIDCQFVNGTAGAGGLGAAGGAGGTGGTGGTGLAFTGTDACDVGKGGNGGNGGNGGVGGTGGNGQNGLSASVQVASGAPLVTNSTLSLNTQAQYTISAVSGAPYCSNTNYTQSACATGNINFATSGLKTINACAGVYTNFVTVGGENETPTISAGGPLNFCSGGSVTLTSTSGPVSQPYTSYQWFNNGVPISGATGQTFTATISGTYTVQGITSCCGNTLTSNSIVVNVTGTNFSYSSTTFCPSSPNQTLSVLPTTSGGTYSISPSLPVANFNPVNGQISQFNTIPQGPYTVTYEVVGCSSSVNITVLPSNFTPISYPQLSYCSNTGLQSPNPFSGSGIFNSFPSLGAALDVNTGQINTDIATVGNNYLIQFTPTGVACPQPSTAIVNILPAPDATFNYSSPSYCQNGVNPIPTISGTAGGSFSAVPSTLVINSTTGAITLATSPSNTYSITYTVGTSPCVITSTVNVIISDSVISDFNYTDLSYCQNATPLSAPANPVSPNYVTNPGGTFSSSPAGLIVGPTGTINLAGSTPGTYTVSYTSAGACSTTTNRVITLNAADDASFNYGVSTVCVGNGTATPISVTLPGGTFSSVPSGIAFNDVNTGEINIDLSTPATYTISYLTNGTCPNTASVNLTVSLPGVSTFSFSQSSYCNNEPNPTPNVTVPGGTFSATPAGLTFLSTATGTIDLTNTTPGTYTITYNSGGPCATTTDQTITINAAGDATFNYAITSFCSNATNPIPTVAAPGGTFSSAPAGLIFVSTATGEINLALSNPGSYTITYNSGGLCPVTQTQDITIIQSTNSFFTYSSTTYCTNATSNPSPLITLPGGTFTSSPAGLVFVNTFTGEINLSASAANTYTITYTSTGTCSTTTTQNITINTGGNPNFNYSTTSLCTNGTNPIPTITTPGGTFTASPAGLNFASTSTGEINLASSIPGTYTITYTSGGLCPATQTQGILISAPGNASFAYSQSSYCQGTANPTPTIANLGGVFTSAPAGLVFSNSVSGTINLNASTPGTYTITYTIAGACNATSTQSVTINASQTATMNYALAGYCQNVSNPSPTFSPAGGTFTVSPGGLTFVSTTTGQINLASSIPGSYVITYTTTGTCPAVITDQVNILSVPVADIVPAGPFCVNSGTQQLTGFPTGGNFISSAFLSSSGTFNPATSGPGTFNISYISTNGFGCADTGFTQVVVSSLPTPTITPAGPLCVGGAATVLSGSPSGGTWGGTPYVSTTGLFSPIAAGTFSVTYTVNNNGCSGTATTNITVNNPPSASITSGTVFCTNSGNQNFTATPAGGTWSGGAYISSGGVFNPTTAGVGSHNVTYTVNTGNCVSTVSATINVSAPPVASIVSPGTLCNNGSSILLSGSPTGGTFSGTPFVTPAGTFNPSVSGVGSFNVTYTVSNAAGCSASTTISVQVIAAPNAAITPAGPFCVNAAPSNLTGVVPGGTWSGGSYISVTGSFNPAVAGVGFATVTYTLTSGGCTSSSSTSVVVNDIPNSSIFPPGPICVTSSPVQLTAANSGGTFGGGAYVTSSGLFNPNVAGIGTVPVTYTLTNSNNCTSTSTLQVTVIAGTPVSIVPSGPFCSNSPTGVLSASVSGGSWGGNPYITGTGQFFPSISGAGTFPVTYTLNAGTNCATTATGTVTVNAAPNATITSIPAICLGSSPVQLNASTPGGTWSGGAYVSASGQFNPNISGTGTFLVTYTVADPLTGCSSSSTNSVSVTPGPSASIFPVAPLCVNAGQIQLIPSTIGGVFSGGAYVTPSGTFNPTTATVGTWQVNYTVSSGACNATGVTFITVYDVPSIAVTSSGPFCENQGAQAITTTPGGGTFSGNPYVTVTGLFYPNQSGIGSFPVTYTVTGTNGCTASNTFNVTVNPIPNSNILSAGPFCANDPIFQLGATTGGGVWSGGNYVTSTGQFIPSLAVNGLNPISYTVTGGNGCSSTSTSNVTVLSIPDVQIAPAGPFCRNTPLQTLIANIPGGVWAGGPYISGFGNFNPVFASVGNNIVTYQVSNTNGCINSDTIFVTIYSVPDATISYPGLVCDGNAPFPLNAATPGGSWSGGPYINNGIFDPQVSGQGIFPVTYTVTDGNNCTNSNTINITVDSDPVASFGYQPNALQAYFTNTSSNATNYAWDFGDGSAGNTAVNPTHTYLDNGTYIVRLIAFNNCGSDTIFIPVTVNKGVGLENYADVQEFNLYPNPALEFAVVEFVSVSASEAKLTLSDINGKQIQNYKVFGDGNHHFKIQLNLTDVLPGVYLIGIETPEGVFVRKLVRSQY